VLRQAVREVLAEVRASRTTPGAEEILREALHRAALTSLGPTRVINATGVVLHTGLGRAPMPFAAARAAAEAAVGYADLEVDRMTGRRGSRTGRAERLLTAITGAEAALVVNNNAAALLLTLAALARGKQVPVSRGELIEIGGEFRLPAIMAASGAKLVEVGTTNRTRLSDYRAAMTDRTGLVLKIHPSNYRVVGFAQAPPASDLAALSAEAGVPFVYDLGSGLLERYPGVPAEEPAVTEALAAGADLVTFSGDKLLGGPQAGIVLGRADLVARLRKHPVARAVRVDKMQLAALEAVLGMYARGERADVPVWRAVSEPAASVRRRAADLAAAIPGATVTKSEAVLGAGSVPGHSIGSHAVRLLVPKPEPLAASLRAGNPSVFCRVEGDAVLFDMRTVHPDEVGDLVRAIRYTLSST
jgi:L-seryl-tRNA(Ser) seleniumtransferase